MTNWNIEPATESNPRRWYTGEGFAWPNGSGGGMRGAAIVRRGGGYVIAHNTDPKLNWYQEATVLGPYPRLKAAKVAYLLHVSGVA